VSGEYEHSGAEIATLIMVALEREFLCQKCSMILADALKVAHESTQTDVFSTFKIVLTGLPLD
jgi:hypothetical protein